MVADRDRNPVGAPTGASGQAPAPSLVRGLSLAAMVALIVGNQLGTSVYTLPAAVAKEAGPLGIVAWIVAALGFFLLAEVFAALGPRYPRTGGPYVFALEAFGRFTGFETVWCYWISTVVGNVAIATGVIAYLGVFIPELDGSPLLRFAFAQALMWGCCWLNVRGVKQSSRVQTAVLVLNLVPFVLLLVALRGFDSHNFTPFAPKGIGGLGAAIALMVWAFAGVESATVTAEEVQGGSKVIRTATRLGFALAAAMFMLGAVAVISVLPNDVIGSSARPLEAVLQATIGPWAARAISGVAVLGAFACLNGWTLMVGRIPMTAAADGLFFAPFAKVHPQYGTPHVSLIAGTAIGSLLLFTYFAGTLLKAFELLVLLANYAVLVPYIASAVAAIVLCWRPGRIAPEGERRWTLACAIGATVFMLFAITQVGTEALKWGSIVIVAGIPLYILLTRRRTT